MATTTAEPVTSTRLPSLPARVAGVIFSPRKTFEAVAAVPRPWGMLLLSIAVIVIVNAVFLGTEVGKQAYVDQQVAGMESFGIKPDDAVLERVHAQARYAPYIQAAAIVVMSPLMSLLMAAILFGVFSGMSGGRGTFKQVFAVVTHAGAIGILQSLFSTPLNYFRQSMSSPTNLMQLLPMFDENSFLGRFLGAVDLFLVWWVVVLGIGLSVLYRRRTGPILVGLFAVYALIALVIAVVKGAFGG